MARELQSRSALAELSYLPPQTPSSKPAYPHSPNTPAANLRDFQGSLPQLSTLPQERRASAHRAVRETHLQHRYRTRSEALDTCGNKSGGRQPAVGIGIALATALPLTHGRPPTVRAPNAGAVAAANPRGADAPPLLVNARISSEMRGCDLQRRFVSHGGLTPPLLTGDCAAWRFSKRSSSSGNVGMVVGSYKSPGRRLVSPRHLPSG